MSVYGADKRHHTLTVLVENKSGVLARVASLFSRRGYNIFSLAVAPSDDERFSRITIVVDVESAPLEQFIDKALEINARGEIGPPDNPDAGAFFARPYQHPGRRRAHAFPPTICTSVCCTTSDSSRLVETSRRLH